MPYIKVIKCNACGHFHPEEVQTECHETHDRLTGEQLDSHFGPAGWQIIEPTE